MKQFAIIGLGNFGRRMLEELSNVECEILIIDKSPETIDLYKDKVSSAFIADAINEEIINRLIPNSIDAAIVDLGDSIEVSILVTNYLKKMGVKHIIVKSESKEHAEILDLIGATQVIFPNREAAKRVAPMLLSSLITSYFPLSKEFCMAEIRFPPKYIGKSLIEINLRREYQINVIAVRKDDGEEYHFFSPEHIIQEDDVFLIAGNEGDISRFANISFPAKQSKGVSDIIKHFFSSLRKNNSLKNNSNKK
jgi:trk system potassium uptake protein TrkA